MNSAGGGGGEKVDTAFPIALRRPFFYASKIFPILGISTPRKGLAAAGERVCMGTTTHGILSSSVDNTIVGKTSCVQCFQQVASRASGVFIGTHTPGFESVRTDDLTVLNLPIRILPKPV